MSDIIDRAARVLHEHYRRTDGLDVTAQESAQALADAGLLARPTPTQEQIADVVGKQFGQGTNIPQMTDAVLELMEGQPTVAEIKATALEEAAEIVETHRQQRRETIGPIDETTMDPLLIQAHDSGSAALIDAKSLILHRAQQTRDGKQ